MIKKNKQITPKSFTKSVKKPKKLSTIGPLSVLILGIALIPGSLLMNSFIQGKIDEGIQEQTVVPSSTSSHYHTFTSNNYPGAPEEYKSFYLWNLTNPSEFLSGAGKPIYEEVGPFKFRDYHYKYDVSYSQDNSEVTYKEYHNYVQVAGENISEVEITNINPALLGGVQLAGGTEREYCEFNLPFVLSQVKDTFQTIYEESMDAQLSDTEWIEQTQTDILSECETLGIGTWVSSKSVPEIFFDCIDISHLQYFLEQGMPSWEDVFYAEWANDSFPAFDGDYDYLVNHVDYTGGGIEGIMAGDIEDLMIQTLQDEDIQKYQNALITKQGSELVDASGSESGEGVDIDGTLTGGSLGSGADLNISNTVYTQISDYEETFWETWLILGTKMDLDRYNAVGGTGITQTQCVNLWNKSDPLSLTGFCNPTLEDKIWIDALNDIGDARDTLMDHFDLQLDQLMTILEWIDTSLSSWVPNALVYQLNDWNSGTITTRTAEDWLFEANDTAVYNRFEYHNEGTDISHVNLFDNCCNQTEAENTYLEHKSYTIRTGHDNPSMSRQIVEYGGHSTVDLWETPEDIHGSLGMYNPPGTNKENPPTIFNPDLMRVIDMEYVGTSSIHGVRLKRFTFAPETFTSNENYYMDTDGLINCKSIERFRGMPVLISKPHFLDTESSVQNSVVGLNPERESHETYIDVEPVSGVTMNAHQRVQVNFNLSSDTYFTESDTTIMPIMWYERSGEVPEDLAARFTDEVYPAQLIQGSILTGGMTIGIALTFAGGSKTLGGQIKRVKIKRAIAPKSKDSFKKSIESISSKLGYKINKNKFK